MYSQVKYRFYPSKIALAFVAGAVVCAFYILMALSIPFGISALISLVFLLLGVYLSQTSVGPAMDIVVKKNSEVQVNDQVYKVKGNSVFLPHYVMLNLKSLESRQWLPKHLVILPDQCERKVYHQFIRTVRMSVMNSQH